MANETKMDTMIMNDALIRDTNNLLAYLEIASRIRVERIDFISTVIQFQNIDENLKDMTRCLDRVKKVKYVQSDVISTYIDLANKSIGIKSEYICRKSELDSIPLELSDTANLLLYLQQLWIKVDAKEKIIQDDAVNVFEQFEKYMTA